MKSSGGAKRCRVSHFVSRQVRRSLARSLLPEAALPTAVPAAEAAQSLKAIVGPKSGRLKMAVAVVSAFTLLVLFVPKGVHEPFLAAPLLGFGAGLLVGASGIGMGSLLAPLLVLLGVSPLITIGTNLVHSFLVRSVGAIQHYRQRTLDTAVLKPLALGAIPASFLGAALTSLAATAGVDLVEVLVKVAIGASLIVLGPMLLVRDLPNRDKWRVSGEATRAVDGHRGTAAVLLGSVLGLVTSITSVGAGSFLVPFLLILGLSPRKVAGTDVLFAAPLTAVPGLLYLAAGKVDVSLLALLLSGSIPGVLLGARFTHRATDGSVRFTLGLSLLFLGLFTVAKG